MRIWEDVTHTRHIRNTCTYHYALLARKFVKLGRVSPTLVVTTILLFGMVKNVEVVVNHVITSKDIGGEVQD